MTKILRIHFPVDTGRKLNVHKTFRRCPGRLMYVQFASYVYGVSFLRIRANFIRATRLTLVKKKIGTTGKFRSNKLK